MKTPSHPSSPSTSGHCRAGIHRVAACLIASLLMQPPPGLAQATGPRDAAPAAVAPADAAPPTSEAHIPSVATAAPDISAAPHPDEAGATADPASALSTAALQLPLEVLYSPVGADNSRNKDSTDQLRVIHLKATQNLVAQQVAINAALMLLSGGLAFGIHTFGKETLLGEPPDMPIQPDSLQNPGMQKLPADLARRAATWLASQPATQGKTFSRPLFVSTPSWRLVYNSWDSGDATYRLQFDAGIYKGRESPSWITGKLRPGKDCHFESEARTLAVWKADAYQAVADTVPQVLQHCGAFFVAQLPDLLELTP